MYVGPLGLLRPLPGHPSSRSPEPGQFFPGAVHESITGRRTFDRMGPSRRTWVLTWDRITEDAETFVQSLLRGSAQVPLVMMDPRKRNLLPDDVSTGGSTSSSSVAFTETGAATLAWQSGGIPVDFLGMVAGRQVWTGVTNTQTLYATSERLPIVAGSTYRVSAYVKTTTTFKFSARPFDLLGVEQATVTDGVNNPSTAGVWARLSWLYTPLAGVCSAYLGMTATGSGNIETCGWMAQIDESLGNWTFGYGCPQVIPVPGQISGSYFKTKYQGLALTLAEV